MNQPELPPAVNFELKYKKLDPDAQAPGKAHMDDLGWDIYALQDTIIPSLNTVLVRTGIAFEFPPSVGGILKDRSSVATKQGLFVHAGVIDPGYRGEILVLMFNSRRVPTEIKTGAKIAQMILMPTFVVSNFVETSTLSESSRGDGGFGSSGA